MCEFVDVKTFEEQIWKIEGIKVKLKLQKNAIEHLVKPYNYPRLPDDATVDDLRARINECVNKPFIISIGGFV